MTNTFQEVQDAQRRPFGTCEQTEKLYKKLATLNPEIASAEKQVHSIKDNIAQRSKFASGNSDYNADIQDIDAENLLRAEQRLGALIERRSKIEHAIKKRHLSRLTPEFESLIREMELLTQEGIEPAETAIAAYQNLRLALRSLAKVERRHDSLRNSAARLRGQIAAISPEFSASIRCSDLHCSATDLLGRMKDGLASYPSDARIYDVKTADFPGLNTFEFDSDDDAKEA